MFSILLCSGHFRYFFSLSLFYNQLGSTDVTAYNTTGVNDPVTSALQIILGKFGKFSSVIYLIRSKHLMINSLKSDW